MPSAIKERIADRTAADTVTLERADARDGKIRTLCSCGQNQGIRRIAALPSDDDIAVSFRWQCKAHHLIAFKYNPQTTSPLTAAMQKLCSRDRLLETIVVLDPIGSGECPVVLGDYRHIGTAAPRIERSRDTGGTGADNHNMHTSLLYRKHEYVQHFHPDASFYQ